MGHIFPYSPKHGTPAARMPQVAAGDDQGARAAALRERPARRNAALAAAAGRHHARRCWSNERTAAAMPRISRRCRVGRAAARRGQIIALRIAGRRGRRPDRRPCLTDTPWLERLRGGFKKTSDRLGDNLTGLFTKAALDDATLDEIEEALIASDLGPATAAKVREPARPRRSSSAASAKARCARSSPTSSPRSSRRSPSRSRSTPSRARR